MRRWRQWWGGYYVVVPRHVAVRVGTLVAGAFFLGQCSQRAADERREPGCHQ